ncbi:MAG: FtsX-like permease family protein [Clostridium sp.]|uniref:FtsX-like permease family protein n=1 Tax=Clostridium sp. TaxID=1506 RepID=UPI003F3D5055
MKLILRSINKNRLDYGIYGIAVMLAVSILYIFNSIIFSEDIKKILNEYKDVNGIFYGAGILLIVIIMIFIWYSNTFFINKRKKEIGIFSLVGMENNKIANIIFGENLLIGIISGICGTILGIILSKYLAKLYSYILGVSYENSHSIFDVKAIVITNVIFFLFYFLVCLNSSSIIEKYQLIDLFKGNNKCEKPFKKTILKGIPGVFIIAIGYMTYPWAIMTLGLSVLITLILVVKGTYKLFRTKVIDRIIEKKNEKGLEDGINLVSTSNLLFRIRSNARILSTVSILIASTITSVGICAALYFSYGSGSDVALLSNIFFIGICISIVFTICTISILLFKFIQEAYDEAPRYKILNQIGFTRIDIKKIITKQLSFVYIAPLIIGIIHSLAALSITVVSMNSKYAVAILIIYGMYALVYFMYFRITRRIYISIIFKNNINK